jgi:hypothetical protein
MFSVKEHSTVKPDSRSRTSTTSRTSSTSTTTSTLRTSTTTSLVKADKTITEYTYHYTATDKVLIVLIILIGLVIFALLYGSFLKHRIVKKRSPTVRTNVLAFNYRGLEDEESHIEDLNLQQNEYFRLDITGNQEPAANNKKRKTKKHQKKKYIRLPAATAEVKMYHQEVEV